MESGIVLWAAPEGTRSSDARLQPFKKGCFHLALDTEAVVLIGEIGGTKEQEAAEYIKTEMKKPVASLIVGGSAPPGKRMGHAGAIISGAAGRADEKMKALKAAGAIMIPTPGDIGVTIQEILGA